MLRTKGPPVLKLWRSGRSSSPPAAGLKFGHADHGAAHAGRQVVLEVVDPLLLAGPAGRALAGLCVVAADGEGAGALGSPKLTAAWSNLATTWRTRATSPCGVKLVI
jgi:hypothetical protein